MPPESVEERLARVEVKIDGLREQAESGDRAVRQLVTFQTERNDELRDLVVELRSLTEAAHRRMDHLTNDHADGSLANRITHLERRDRAIEGLTNIAARLEGRLEQLTDPATPGSLAFELAALAGDVRELQDDRVAAKAVAADTETRHRRTSWALGGVVAVLTVLETMQAIGG